MKTSASLLSRIELAAPCDVAWEAMTGDERIRHCQLCNLSVYNISEMTSREAEAFLLENIASERVCGRILRRKDGTIVTDNCPRGLRAARNAVRGVCKRVAAVAALLLTTFGLTPPEAEALDPRLGGFKYRPPNMRPPSEILSAGELDPVKVTLTYIDCVQKTVDKSWKLPTEDADKKLAIRFKVQRDGSPTDLKLTTSSGSKELDDQALSAIRHCHFEKVPESSPAPVVLLHSFEAK